MIKKVEVEAIPLEELQREYETDGPIEDYLRQAAYVELIESEGELLIPVQMWRRFVRHSIHSVWDPPSKAVNTEQQPQKGAESRDEPGRRGFVPRWNSRRQELIDHNPWLGSLAENFVNYLLAHDSSASAEPHGQTITLIMSRGRRAGLRLRAGRGERAGLWLVAERNGMTHEELVRSEDDFERALLWLQNLPDY